MKRFIRQFIMQAAVGSLLVVPFTSVSAAAVKQSDAASDLNEVYQLIQKNHVSAPDAKKLSEAAIKGMLSSLDDPYTQYMSPAEWENFQNSIEQHYVGIGARIGEDEQGFFAAEIFKGSPAEAGGIVRGDYITAVQGKLATGLKIDQLVSLIVGDENTKVALTVRSGDQSREVTLTRKTITIPVVESKFVQGGVGYIRLSSFSSDADTQFAAKLAELKKANLQSLVIDLRDNGGGLVNAAANIAKLFIKEGTFIHTNDRNHVDDPIVIHGGASVSFPVFVLVNENSASASEQLTGALQDYKIATVIGAKSFGKGSVQNIIPLQNGGVLKVTIEEYLTPNSRKVNKVGITPDQTVIGNVPQLLTALHNGGIHDLKLTRDYASIMINGADFNDNFPVRTVGDLTYVPSRILSSMIEGNIAWDEATQSVEISSGDQSAKFAISAGDLLTDNGNTYLDLASFSRKFPQLEWSMNGGKLSLHVAKGN